MGVLRVSEDVGMEADGVFLYVVADLFVGGEEDLRLGVDSNLFKHCN